MCWYKVLFPLLISFILLCISNYVSKRKIWCLIFGIAVWLCFRVNWTLLFWMTLCIFLNTQWIIFNFSRKSFHFLVWLKKKKQTKNGNSRLWIPILQSNGNPWETDCGCIERSLLLHFSSRCHMRAVNRFGWLASVTPPQPGQPRLS